MSYSSSKQLSHIASLYESIYTESLNEEQQNQLLMVEWYNALVKEGLIKGSLIENGIISENVFAKVGQAIATHGPKVMNVARKVTGFGLGPGTGGKRKALTIGAGTVTATDPQKSAQQVGGAVTGTASALNRAGRAAMGQAVPAANKKNEYQYNSFDPFDAIKGHLLDEGYADTEEAALKIMANMSEEWKQSIVEQTARIDYVQDKFNRENAAKSGSALTAIPGKQNTGQALQRAKESARQMGKLQGV